MKVARPATAAGLRPGPKEARKDDEERGVFAGVLMGAMTNPQPQPDRSPQYDAPPPGHLATRPVSIEPPDAAPSSAPPPTQEQATTIDVTLDGLGRVQVQVEPTDDGVRVSIKTENEQAASLIDQRKDEILEAIRGSGIADGPVQWLGGRPTAGATASTTTPSDGLSPPAPRKVTSTGNRTRRGLVDEVA